MRCGGRYKEKSDCIRVRFVRGSKEFNVEAKTSHPFVQFLCFDFGYCSTIGLFDIVFTHGGG